MYGLKTSYLPVFSNSATNRCKHSNQPKFAGTKNQNVTTVSESLDSKNTENGEGIIFLNLLKSTHRNRKEQLHTKPKTHGQHLQQN